MSKVFIGAFGGAGTRIVMECLSLAGMYVAEDRSNDMYDYRNTGFVRAFDKYYLGKKTSFETSKLKKIFDEVCAIEESYALKHGHIMYIPQELREAYPGCKLIYMMRNPIDCALKKEYVPHITYGGKKNATLDQKIEYYIKESTRAQEEFDFVIRLEDLVNNPKEELQRLFEFVGLPLTCLDEAASRVKRSSTIGEGKDLYDSYDMSALGY